MENAVWVDVMPVMLLIFSTVFNALMGSLVLSRITRSKRPVTGVTDSMLPTRLSWLTICPCSPLAFATTKLVDAELDSVCLKSIAQTGPRLVSGGTPHHVRKRQSSLHK